ncbi:MAG: tetratricopeptide repeat protein [Maribacter sp.]|nr:tetratricopeptide repeat protein [Maribacter sp.]
MRNYFIKFVPIFAFSILNWGQSFAQLIDFDSENPYKKVFVATDNFGASYLQILEEGYLKAKTDSLKFSILNDLAYYWHTRNLVKAMKYTKKGLRMTAKNSNTLWEGRFQVTQGAILLRMEKLDSAEAVLAAAKSKIRESDLAFLNTQLGYVYERRGRIDKAADYALESLRLGTKLNDKKAIALAYSDLSNLFWKQAKYETGLEYGLKSLEIFEERGINDLDYGFTLYVVGNNYLALKNYSEALQYFEHAIVIGERYGFYNNLSDTYISVVDLYAYMGKFKKAEEAATNALKYADSLTNKFMEMRAWLSIGKLQNLEGKYIAAIESLTKCITIASDKFGDKFYLSQAYETLGKAHAGNHEYREAYQAFAEYDELKSAVFTAEADERISKLKTEFEVADKEGTILLQETMIKRQRTNQTLISIITGLLLLLLILFYKAIQINRTKNRLLQKKNEEKEFLLKEIHHRVKNNLEMVSSLLALQSARIKDPNILDAMYQSQHRVQCMSMIHQKLYLGKNLSVIEMKDYFKELADYVIHSFGAERQVTVDINMNPLELDVDMAIPIGLIVNELLTNSLKYAFPNQKPGKIQISLKETHRVLQLDVIDNGVGKLEGEHIKGTGFGSHLVDLLTQQLDGKMVLNTHKGRSVSIQFQLHKAA